MNRLWLLTTEYNDYDQHGEYFVELFAEFPTFEQLLAAGVEKEHLEHVKNGGGRTKEMENQWWHLRRYTPKAPA